MKTGTIDPLAAYQMMQQDTTSVLLDVRTPMEYQRAHVAGSIHVPLDMLSRAGLPAECDTCHNVLLLCESGARAARARELLHNTCPAASVIQGGIAAWQLAGLPVVKGTHQSRPLMQQVQIVAGLITLVGSLLTLLHPAFIIIPVFVGTGLTLSGLTGACPMACVLARMPWNRIACTGPLREGRNGVSHA